MGQEAANRLREQFNSAASDDFLSEIRNQLELIEGVGQEDQNEIEASLHNEPNSDNPSSPEHH